MSLLRHALWITALLLPAVASGEGREPYISWGKQGVPFERYRMDSVACGMRGATRDMSGQQAFKDVVHGANFQDSALDRGDTLEYVMIYKRNFRGNIPELQRFLVNDVEECLMSEGYVPFALTREQEKKLSKYQKGSQDRFQYLHRLSSDPKILRAQQLELARK